MVVVLLLCQVNYILDAVAVVFIDVVFFEALLVCES